MKNGMKWVVGGVLAALVAGGVVAWFARADSGAPLYRLAKIERGALVASVSATGTVTPVTQVSVGTQVSGQIKELFVDFNDNVKAGQLIARIDPQSFEYKLRQVQADLDSARAAVLNAQANTLAVAAAASRAALDVTEAQRNLVRNEALVKQGFISAAQLDTFKATVANAGELLKAAQAQVQVSHAQVASAQAAVKQRDALVAQARIDIERTQIRSPVDGVVIKRSVELGQTVASSLQSPELFVIARNLNDMQVQVSIDEADISRVRLGQKASFTVDAFPGRSFEGVVAQVRKAATNTQNVITYAVIVTFSNADQRLLPGMTANARLVTDTREGVLKLPNAALRVRLPGVAEPVAAGASGALGASGPRGGASAVAAGPAASAPAGGGGGGGGGPLAQMRARLTSELQLSPAQGEKVDALFAAVRPQYGQLRDLPEEERGRARERVTAELRARIAEQLTPEQKTKYDALVAELSGRQATRGRIYLVGADGKPRAVNVRLGISDGTSTELLVSPTGREAGKDGNNDGANELTEGVSVVVGLAAAGSTSGAGPGAGAARPAGGPRMGF